MDHLRKGTDYLQAGVDIAAGEAAVKAIKDKVRSTYNANVLSDLGSFGGLYRLDLATWHNPVLVSSTDGVGTKLRIAIMANEFGTIGQDLVNHCVNDILVQGAIPQYFLDYIGVGKLQPEMIEGIVDGLIIACKENGCALIGGEMAEMPGFYQTGDFDLAGTIVGIVEQSELLPRKSMAIGDVLVALPSSGFHTNGYSLVRKLVFEQMNLGLDTYIQDCGASLGDLLLSVHRSYLPVLKPWLNNPALHGLAHITGGGISGNLKRVIPEGMSAVVTLREAEIPPLFRWVQAVGKISWESMMETFNNGVGMVCIVGADSTDQFIGSSAGVKIGELVEARNNKVFIKLT